MSSAGKLVQASFKYLGTPYDKMDCQAFVEACLRDIGINKNLPGSNAWYRTMTWVGTPEECVASFGKIPVGAFLFILKHDDKEPEKYKSDGIGNASHIGIYTGLTGQGMVKIATSDGVQNAGEYDFGDGAINSSSTHGCVCTSKFEGKSINGGWNRIGLWDKLSYDIEGGESMVAIVTAPSGRTVNLRIMPRENAPLIERVPVGAQVVVTDRGDEWSIVEYGNYKGYMMSKYLAFDDQEIEEIVQVDRQRLERIYDELGDILGMRG